MYYLAFSHYARTSHRPIMYLTAPANPTVLRQLDQFKQVWLIGPTVTMDVSTYLPGWNAVFSRGFPNSGSFTEMKRDNSRATSPSPWHPKTP